VVFDIALGIIVAFVIIVSVPILVRLALVLIPVGLIAYFIHTMAQ